MKACDKCGRTVSSNKHYCMTCIKEMAQAGVEAKEEEPMDETTHIIVKLDSKGQEDLYRADGMLVASRQGDMVRFGHDIATAQSRLFLNKEMAAMWLRKLAALDIECHDEGVTLHSRIELAWLARQVPVIEERDGESLLTLPGKHTQVSLH